MHIHYSCCVALPDLHGVATHDRKLPKVFKQRTYPCGDRESQIYRNHYIIQGRFLNQQLVEALGTKRRPNLVQLNLRRKSLYPTLGGFRSAGFIRPHAEDAQPREEARERKWLSSIRIPRLRALRTSQGTHPFSKIQQSRGTSGFRKTCQVNVPSTKFETRHVCSYAENSTSPCSPCARQVRMPSRPIPERPAWCSGRECCKSAGFLPASSQHICCMLPTLFFFLGGAHSWQRSLRN